MALPLILAGLQVGGALASGIQNNQQKQKQKGVIGRAYKLGKERLGTRQGDQRQAQAESIGSRGLGGGGIRVASAVAPMQRPKMAATGKGLPLLSPGGMAPIPGTGNPRASVTGARTLGQQQQADMGREQQYEQDALLEQKNAALAGLNADAAASLVGTVGQGIGGAIQGYQTGTTYNAYKGIDPVNPLGRGAWAPTAGTNTIYNESYGPPEG